MRIILGILGVALSLALVVKREQVQRFTGPISWAESHLGQGGTFTLYLLIGIFGFFFSLAYMTGSLDFFIGGLANKFFSTVK